MSFLLTTWGDPVTSKAVRAFEVLFVAAFLVVAAAAVVQTVVSLANPISPAPYSG